MPTVSTRNFPRQRNSPYDRLTGGGGGQPHSNHTLPWSAVEAKPLQMDPISRTDMSEAELKWSPGMQSCPAPACKYTFWWSSPPKTLSGKKGSKAPQEIPVEPYKNVMYERRVVRGSNFTNANLMADTDPFDKAAELRRRQALRKKTQCRNQRNILGTPPPVKGRRHEVIQTEKYLEELVQRPPEFSVNTQTDLFLERPPTPPYVPAKVGIDASTEIAEGELFHFDAEAQPIIEILVDACIEQSMLEVAHEQEIDALRRKQEEFLALREAELAELRRLEAEEMRLRAEKERRLRQDAIAKELDDEMQKGVTAAKLLQGHIAGLLPEVLENLEPATDAAKKEQLMKTICPWLTQEVAEEVGQIVDSREILTVIIQEIIKQRASAYAGYKEEEPLEAIQIREIGEEECEGEQEVECCECKVEESEGCPQGM